MKNVSTRVSEDVVDQFDRALMEAQLSDDIEIEMNVSRSEGIRILMKNAIDDPTIFNREDKQ